ncbi:MAG: hydrogenase maturation protease [Dehalococcoidales bacterium]|nr:hydrogenase maturation protease [Dehalococcoidales bacterium]
MAEPLEAEPRVLIVGIGNAALQDEGVGVIAVEAFRRAHYLPYNVDLISGELEEIDLPDVMEEASHVIVVDCVVAEMTPGQIFREILDEFRRPGDTPESMHEAQVLSALGVLEMLGTRPQAILIGVQVAEVGPGGGLSAAVEASLPRVIEMIEDELANLGFETLPVPSSGEAEGDLPD